MKTKLKNELKEFRLLLDSVPGTVLALFIISIFSMNLLANKSISLPFDWLALDCGIIVSWFAFLTMDVITTRFGPKGATQLSVFALFLDLLFCLIFFVAGAIPGMWGEAYVAGSEAILNSALDRTFGGTWYVLAGSAFAFTVSAFVNNFLNHAIGKLLRKKPLFKKKPDSGFVYAMRAYISTAAGQFCDNLVFALTVSHFFFGWTLLQCVTCAMTGMFAELLCEIIFSFFGYRLCESWRKKGVGKEYLEYISKKEKA